MVEESVARLLLETARRDAHAVEVLARMPDMHDAIVGFHAQQAVEKALKAVLSANGIAFRRTHDIAERLDLIADNRLAPPPHADILDEFNPFAVEARYGLVGVGTLALPRSTVCNVIEDVLRWAGGMVNR
ncbi:MAG: HEPN domain-containing protein [Betaproteobacteria bacterium]|nr:HEPN domain-containing protein [Betaproteobacteria bacterium]